MALTEVEKSIKEVKPGTAFELALEKHKQLADKYPEHKPFYEMMVKTLKVQENVMEDWRTTTTDRGPEKSRFWSKLSMPSRIGNRGTN